MAAEATPALLYLPELLEPGSRLRLSPEDGHYVARVCRARAGELLEATDGRGALASLRLVEARGGVVVEVESVRRWGRGRRAWVLCGAPEGERADWLVEKLAELGVERLVLVDFAVRAWKRAEARRTRWGRLAIAALRQSRRLHLMEIEGPRSFERAVKELPPESTRWLADESGRAAAPPSPGSVPAVGLIGPSAGLLAAERATALEQGFQPLWLADARLRTETAAVAWTAWWSAHEDPPAEGGERS